MDNILFSAALAFLVTFFSIPVVINIAKVKKLFDEPDERKVHKSVIPTLGGIGIFSGFIMAFLMGSPAGANPQFQYLVAGAFIIFFLGLKDDIMILNASKKFVVQLVAAGILIRFGGIYFHNLQGFLGIYEIPYLAGYLVSAFTIIVITNSFNLIDGVDGLAGSLGFLTTMVFGIYFFIAGEISYAVMAFALSGSIASFLIYNFAPAKIFMGDTGSLLIGLINSILVIKFISVAGASDAVAPIASAPAIGFAVLMIPLFDTLRVFGIRILDRRSPFSPDRLHVHHFLLDLGFSHRKVVFTLLGANLLFIGLAFLMRNLPTTLIIGALLATAFTFVGILYYFRIKSRSVVEEKRQNVSVMKTTKILNLTPEVVEMD